MPAWRTRLAALRQTRTAPPPVRPLRQRRQERNLSQAELIRRTALRMELNLGCDPKRVGRWERGEVGWPSPAYRRVLCAVFAVTSVAELGFRPPIKSAPTPLTTAPERQAVPLSWQRPSASGGTRSA